jgi:hypothetical protein
MAMNVKIPKVSEEPAVFIFSVNNLAGSYRRLGGTFCFHSRGRRLEVGGSGFFENVGNIKPGYAASHPRRLKSPIKVRP